MIVDNHTHGLSGTVYRAGCPECQALNRARMRRYLSASADHAEAHRISSRDSHRRLRARFVEEGAA
ncbi:hypothetical protein AB3M83_07605 [Microbacterium sp. 179-B 1A2 NHS]|uniref:hypothetical protein n=1 Tax=Microbacterium sp. 179-B 1A2 NHS TaxID=3142383 RepID=UPI0039A19469